MRIAEIDIGKVKLGEPTEIFVPYESQLLTVRATGYGPKLDIMFAESNHDNLCIRTLIVTLCGNHEIKGKLPRYIGSFTTTFYAPALTMMTYHVFELCQESEGRTHGGFLS